MSDRITAFISRISEPHASVHPLEEQYKVRFLSLVLLLASLLPLAISGIIYCMTGELMLWVVTLGLVILPAYLISRTAHYNLAAGVGVVLFGFPTYYILLKTQQFTPMILFFALAWLIFPLMLSSIMLSIRAMLVTLAVVLFALLLLPMLTPQLTYLNILAPLAFITATTGLVAAAALIRRGYLQQTIATKRTLQAMRDDLELRVMERTAILQKEIAMHERTQQELAFARDQALAALNLKARILSNVSHDARTPLSVIMLRAEMLQHGMYGSLTDQQQEAVSSILISAKDLLDFVDNLLQESQLNTTRQMRPGQLEMIPAVWLEDLAETFRLVALDKDIHMRVETESAPPLIISDPAWLRNIMNNLINNALRFTKEGGQVTLRTFTYDETHWALQVQDTGIGMGIDTLLHIYEPFWQADNSDTREIGRGIGLGLAVVRNLIRLMDGRIEVSSTPGEGSTFTIVLPLISHLPQAQ